MRCTAPAWNQPSCRSCPRTPRSTSDQSNERGAVAQSRAAVHHRNSGAGDHLADRLPVFPRLPVSVDPPDRAPLRRHRHHLVDAGRRADDGGAHHGRAGRRLCSRRACWRSDQVGRASRAMSRRCWCSAGHSGAVVGRHRHHLVSRHRVPHLLHHGDDDAAGLHLPDPRRRPLDVEGPVRDDHVVPAAALDAVPGADPADGGAGHPDGVEGQPRQRVARGGGGRAGRRDRRRRLRAAAPAAVVRHGRRHRLDAAARAVRAGGAADHHGDRDLGAALPAVSERAM